MMELTIGGTTYQFNFGMGFMRAVNKKYQKPVDNIPGVKENVGLQYLIAGILGGSVEFLVELLEAANGGQNPRVTRTLLDEYIDDPTTDIDALFKDTLDFLRSANATKSALIQMEEALEEQKRKMAEA